MRYDRIAVYGAIALSLAGFWYSVGRLAAPAYNRFMAKCQSDINLSLNAGRIASALERRNAYLDKKDPDETWLAVGR